jgi:hypothetical protein
LNHTFEDFDDTNCNMGFTQDPMERASPPSLPPSKEKVQNRDNKTSNDDSDLDILEDF